MSKPYFRPQVVIQQEFTPLAGTIVQPQNVLLIGPIYKVFEGGDSDDSLHINYGPYNPDSDTEYNYGGLPTGGVVDQASVKLIMRDLWAEYATLSAAGSIKRGAANNEIKITGDGFQTYDNGADPVFNRNAVFINRDVAIGDRVRVVAAGGVDLKTRVIGFKHAKLPAAVADPDISASRPDKVASVALDVALSEPAGDHIGTAAGTYIGSLAKGVIGEVYTVTCSLGGIAGVAKFTVTSTQGDNIPTVASVALGSPMNVGTRGVTLSIAGTGSYVSGETYVINAAAAHEQITPTLTSAPTAFDGLYDTIYTVKVVKGGTWDKSPQVVVTTQNGIDGSAPAVVEEGVNFLVGTLGVTASIEANAQNGLLYGDVFTIAATASKKGKVETALLANPLPASVIAGADVAAAFHIFKSEMEIPVKGYPTSSDQAVMTEEDTFTVSAGISIVDPTWTDVGGTQEPIPIRFGTVTIPYRVLVTAQANDTHSISEISAVETILGKIVEENPMAYAMDKALANSGGQTVFYIPIASDDIEGYRQALAAHESDQQGYIVVPLTEDRAVRDLVKAHVFAMTGGENGGEVAAKRSIGFTPSIIDEVTEKYSKKETGENWTGYVWEDPDNNGEFTHVTVPGATFITDGIRPTDILRTDFSVDAFGNDTYVAKEIDHVVDEETLVLKRPGFSNNIGSDTSQQRIEIIRNLTYDEQAQAAEADAEAMKTRRIYNVFPDFPIECAWHFLAAAIAGLASSVAPHQGLTNASINGFNDHDGVRKRFTPSQLDVMAQGGVLIATRPKDGGQTFIRHQLSTDNTDDNRSELSVTRNLDAISDALEADLKQFIGKYNNTEHLLQLVDTLTRQKLTFFIAETRTVTAGPMLIGYDEKTLKVTQNSVAKTQVDVEADLTLPLPVNRIHVKLRVTA